MVIFVIHCGSVTLNFIILLCFFPFYHYQPPPRALRPLTRSRSKNNLSANPEAMWLCIRCETALAALAATWGHQKNRRHRGGDAWQCRQKDQIFKAALFTNEVTKAACDFIASDLLTPKGGDVSIQVADVGMWHHSETLKHLTLCIVHIYCMWNVYVCFLLFVWLWETEACMSLSAGLSREQSLSLST